MIQTTRHVSVHMRLGIPCTNQYLVLFSSLRELLVVTGGYSWNSILARTEALNMTAEEGNRWKRLAPLLKPRYLHACSPIQLGTEVPALYILEELSSFGKWKIANFI